MQGLAARHTMASTIKMQCEENQSPEDRQ